MTNDTLQDNSILSKKEIQCRYESSEISRDIIEDLTGIRCLLDQIPINIYKPGDKLILKIRGYTYEINEFILNNNLNLINSNEIFFVIEFKDFRRWIEKC